MHTEQQWRGSQLATPSIRLWEKDGAEIRKDLSDYSSPVVAVAVLGTLAAYASSDGGFASVWAILSVAYWIYLWVLAELNSPGFWAQQTAIKVLAQLPLALTSLSYLLMIKVMEVVVQGYYFVRWSVSK
ncbi:MAG: hypothetical protein OQK12_18710 [Motiliproteus sp.]|nr:hypothetical protein [Motiliproteus sp.]MCW9053256.1 hypothetical protein [Motiliproteus sp.]